jgi:cell division protein FtsB
MDKYEGIVTDQSAQLISLEEENADLKRQVKYLQSEQAHQTEQSAVRIKNL